MSSSVMSASVPAFTIHADSALTPQGWRRNVRLAVAGGRIAAVESGGPAAPGDQRHGLVLPAMPNLHSHAFQRAMAGLAERRGAGSDNFWSWREAMYRLARSMSPAQVEAVASQLYVEMLEAGFCRVGEFHYLHHDVTGAPYANRGEMAERIAAAAAKTGIGLSLLPVFYAHSSFGGAPPTAGQSRFISSVDSYAALLDASRAAVKRLSTGIVGVAPHSLRATTPEELEAVAKMAGPQPIHIHIAEQTKEVEDCVAWSGQRPVEWLLAHLDVGSQWCLVHATHMTDAETRALVDTSAVAGLCPITESNLGDGIFNAAVFSPTGRFGVGSDSNVQIDAAAELRQLEYSQRLLHRMRNVTTAPEHSTGRTLFDAAIAGGGQAVGATPGLQAGAPADLITLNLAHPILAGRAEDAALDAWIFGGAPAVDCVWVAGDKLVEGGHHRARTPIAREFRAVMQALADA